MSRRVTALASWVSGDPARAPFDVADDGLDGIRRHRFLPAEGPGDGEAGDVSLWIGLPDGQRTSQQRRSSGDHVVHDDHTTGEAHRELTLHLHRPLMLIGPGSLSPWRPMGGTHSLDALHETDHFTADPAPDESLSDPVGRPESTGGERCALRCWDEKGALQESDERMTTAQLSHPPCDVLRGADTTTK